jgi:hypothetical protein
VNAVDEETARTVTCLAFGASGLTDRAANSASNSHRDPPRRDHCTDTTAGDRARTLVGNDDVPVPRSERRDRFLDRSIVIEVPEPGEKTGKPSELGSGSR